MAGSNAARFEGKTVLVTGGSSGIGLATAKAFATEGARVVIAARSEGDIAKAETEIGNGAVGVVCDVTDRASLDRLTDRIRDLGTGLHAVFANAGIARFAPFDQTDAAMVRSVMDVNVLGVLQTTQAVVPLMGGGGAIVVTTSMNNRIGMPMSAAYAASKAAARSLVRVLAAELRPNRIRVNAVSPGPTETPIYDTLGMPKEQVEGFAKDLTARIPMHRFADPSEIARAVLYLASDEASFTTGEEVVVDGGWSAIGSVTLPGEAA